MDKFDYAGIEVSMKELLVGVSRNGKDVTTRTFTNTAAGHKQIARHLARKGRTTRVAIECTGVYSIDLGMALSSYDGIELMMANPRSVRDYARALLRRSKNDKEDTLVLVEYAKNMPFRRYIPPSETALKLRSISRQVNAFINQITQDKNRLHATLLDSTASKLVAKTLKKAIRDTEKLVSKLEAAAIELIQSDPELNHKFELLITVKGIAERSGIRILGELACLPEGLDPRQLTAMAGLDPVVYKSGQSVNKRRGISKQGISILREALFMPAFCAITKDKNVRAFYLHLVEKGKLRMVAVVAVMRKLLHSIWGMFKNNEPFNSAKFYASPATTFFVENSGFALSEA